MLILVLETSTDQGCIALSQNGELIDSKTLEGGRELSKTLATQVKNLLGNRIPDLIAVGKGPGSYTGIRVGAALAKALAYGWQKPLIGFCSLEAFGPAPVLIDARAGGFYALLNQKPELVSPEDERLQTLPLIRSPHPDLIQKRLSSKATFQQTKPDPKSLVKLLYMQFLERGAEPFELDYLSHP